MKANLYVISYKRAETISGLDPFIIEHGYFVVHEEESEDYRRNGANKIIVQPPTGLVGARNCALDHAQENDAACVQIDDDLVKVNRNACDGKVGEKVPFEEGFDALTEFCEKSKAMLCGVPPTPNAFFAKKRVHDNGFIIGSLMIAKPCGIRFDPGLRLKEDYDYTLQHIQKYGLVQRLQTYLYTFKHYSNAGGAVAVRNDETEQASILYLLKKWSGAVKVHPRRKNEVMIQSNLNRFMKLPSP